MRGRKWGFVLGGCEVFFLSFPAVAVCPFDSCEGKEKAFTCLELSDAALVLVTDQK